MLYAKTESGECYDGRIDDITLRINLTRQYDVITEIKADGYELNQCCDILGRRPPSARVHIFLGNNAKEIAMNWTT